MNNRQSNIPPAASAGHIYVNGYGFVDVDPRLQQERAIRKNAAVTGLSLVGILAFSTVCPYVTTLLIKSVLAVLPLSGDYGSALALTQLRDLLSYVLAMGIPLLLAVAILRPQRGSIALRRFPSDGRLLSDSMIIALAVTVLLEILSNCVDGVFAYFRILELRPYDLHPGTPGALGLYLLRVTVLPALLEELLFRGVLLRSLRQFGDAFALVASSAAFGLIHYSLTKDLSGFVLGLVLGYFVIRTRSVFTAVFSRFLTLLLPVVLRLLQHIAPTTVYHIAAYGVKALILAAAIGVFILICRREGNAFVLSGSHTEIPISRKLRAYFWNVPMMLASLLWLSQIVLHIHFIG